MTVVNPQITDAVAPETLQQGNVAMANLYLQYSQAVSLAAHNAASAQAQGYVTMQAATAAGIATLYALDSASTGEATKKIYSDATRAVHEATPATAAPALPSSKVSDDFPYAMRTCGVAYAAALDAMSAALSRNCQRALEIAATAACFAAMVANPDKTDQYNEVLKAIRTLS